MRSPDYLRAKGNARRSKSVLREKPMKREYDFSKAERGKFHSPEATFSFPVYLDPDVGDFMGKLADEKKMDVQDLVNEWLRVSMGLVRSIR